MKDLSLSGTLLVLGALLLGACDLIQEEPEPPADPLVEVQAHLDRFVDESAERGGDFHAAVEALEVSFQDEIVVDGITYCGYVPIDDETGLYTKRVLFSLHASCWPEASDAAREALVFHELGHAILDRWHRDDLLPNNARASIMVSKNAGSLYDGKAAYRRPYYVDELFDPATPVPDWALE